MLFVLIINGNSTTLDNFNHYNFLESLCLLSLPTVVKLPYHSWLTSLLLTVGTKGLRVHSFLSAEDFYHEVKTNVSNEFCFGFELSDVKPGVEEINITYMFPRDASLDTH